LLWFGMNAFPSEVSAPVRRRNPLWLVVQAIGSLLLVAAIASFANYIDDQLVSDDRLAVQALAEAAVLTGANVSHPATPNLYLRAIGAPGRTPEETANRVAVLTAEASRYVSLESNDNSVFVALATAAVGALALGLNRVAKFVRTVRNVPD
jgi:hypothetical protein